MVVWLAFDGATRGDWGHGKKRGRQERLAYLEKPSSCTFFYRKKNAFSLLTHHFLLSPPLLKKKKNYPSALQAPRAKPRVLRQLRREEEKRKLDDSDDSGAPGLCFRHLDLDGGAGLFFRRRRRRRRRRGLQHHRQERRVVLFGRRRCGPAVRRAIVKNKQKGASPTAPRSMTKNKKINLHTEKKSSLPHAPLPPSPRYHPWGPRSAAVAPLAFHHLPFYNFFIPHSP